MMLSMSKVDKFPVSPSMNDHGHTCTDQEEGWCHTRRSFRQQNQKAEVYRPRDLCVHEMHFDAGCNQMIRSRCLRYGPPACDGASLLCEGGAGLFAPAPSSLHTSVRLRWRAGDLYCT